MKVYNLIYILSTLLVYQLLQLESDYIDIGLQVVCCIGIMTLGIAHGSIDNVIFGVDSKKSNKVFIIVYVLLVLAFIGLWAISAFAALALFLLISAYHFGQSQFEEYKFNAPIMSKFLYLIWGSLILFSPIFFHQENILLLHDVSDLSPSITIFLEDHVSVIFFGLSAIFLLVFISMCYKFSLRASTIFTELALIIYIVLSFKLLPTFIAFSLFFIFIHSLRVVIQEYRYCRLSSKIDSGKEFFHLCLPLTSVSIVGILLIAIVLYFLNMVSLIPFALIVVLSGITFPHFIVMEKFYANLR